MWLSNGWRRGSLSVMKRTTTTTVLDFLVWPMALFNRGFAFNLYDQENHKKSEESNVVLGLN
jgi:hypothetical protein